MKTYSEVMGREPFDWWDALEKAASANEQYWEELEDRAHSWVTCPCGNLSNDIPRDDQYGFPLDDELHLLGMDFCPSIIARLWDRAKVIRTRIEQRATEVLRIVGTPEVSDHG